MIAGDTLKNLQLAVKTEYFNDIKSGVKTEEYRLCNEYWTKRLSDKRYNRLIITCGYPKRDDKDKILSFPYVGWERKTITHKHFGDSPVEVFAIKITEKPQF